MAGVIVDISMSLAGSWPGLPERGAGSVTLEQVRLPAAYRLYRATVTEHSVIARATPGGRVPSMPSLPTIGPA